jgi:hypothetical protein
MIAGDIVSLKILSMNFQILRHHMGQSAMGKLTSSQSYDPIPPEFHRRVHESAPANVDSDRRKLCKKSFPISIDLNSDRSARGGFCPGPSIFMIARTRRTSSSSAQAIANSRAGQLSAKGRLPSLFPRKWPKVPAATISPLLLALGRPQRSPLLPLRCGRPRRPRKGRSSSSCCCSTFPRPGPGGHSGAIRAVCYGAEARAFCGNAQRGRRRDGEVLLGLAQTTEVVRSGSSH